MTTMHCNAQHPSHAEKKCMLLAFQVHDEHEHVGYYGTRTRWSAEPSLVWDRDSAARPFTRLAMPVEIAKRKLERVL